MGGCHEQEYSPRSGLCRTTASATSSNVRNSDARHNELDVVLRSLHNQASGSWHRHPLSQKRERSF